MAAIKQYPLQLHEEIITLCCVEPKSLRHFFETGCSSSTPSFTCPWTLRLIKEKAGKVGHRGAAIFHLSSGAADQRVNAKVLKLLLERIFDDSLFLQGGVVCLCACQQKVQWQQQKSVRSSPLKRSGCILIQLLNVILWGVGGEKISNSSFNECY